MEETNNNVPQQQTPQPVDRSSFAIASLVLGIASIPLICICVGFITAILGIVFGALSLNSSKKGMALAGVICSVAAIVIFILIVILNVVFSSRYGSFNWNKCY